MRWAISSLLLLCLPPVFAGEDDLLAEHRDGVVLAGFAAGVPESQKIPIFAVAGAAQVKRIGAGVHVLNVGPGRVAATIRLLKAHREIRYAEPDYIGTLAGSTTPNDANLGLQWAVQNTGQTVNGTAGTPGADERTLPAWSVSTGANSVVVAVVDTGVQYSHPDLATNMWINTTGYGGCAVGTSGYNVLTGTCDPMDDDTNYGGHGSHVAGILGAVGNNAAGVAGVNWTTSIMAVKWVTGGGVAVTSDLITALDWVVKAKQSGVNVRVVNDSATWPGTAYSQALSDELDLLGSNDILFVTAAGNTAQNNDTTARYPCSYNRPNMICVAASDQNDNLWSSSNYGLGTVELAAPGVNIYSTKRLSNFGYISGTSMASPQVAGTAALILSLGYQSVSSLKSMILAAVDPLPSLQSYVSTGGRLNVCKAVNCGSAVVASPVIATAPAVTGFARAGSLLGASTGIWSGSPAQFAYQWYRCDGAGTNCTAVSGATTQNYPLLAAADAGSTFRVSVMASNTAGGGAAQSTPSAVVASSSSPFAISSTIQNGQTISGTVQWQANPAQTVNFVQFYVDGALVSTDTASSYVYSLNTAALSNGSHALGLRALSSDNRTYGFFGATANVANGAGAGLAITTGSLPGGVLNKPYSATLTATGGTAPYTWSVISGSLPPGLSLNAASGLISGTPTSNGVSKFTAQVKDSSGATASKAFSLSISRH